MIGGMGIVNSLVSLQIEGIVVDDIELIELNRITDKMGSQLN